MCAWNTMNYPGARLRKHLTFSTSTCVLVIRRCHALISGCLHSEAEVQIKRHLLNHVGSGVNVRKARCENAWSHPRLQWWLSFPPNMVISCYAFFIGPWHYFLPSVLNKCCLIITTVAAPMNTSRLVEMFGPVTFLVLPLFIAIKVHCEIKWQSILKKSWLRLWLPVFGTRCLSVFPNR